MAKARQYDTDATWKLHPERLRAARLSMGFDQVEVAKLAGIGRTHYCRLETGAQTGITLETAGRIADVVDVGLDELCNRRVRRR